MNSTEIKLAILLENLHIKCIYYPEDRYGCKKLKNISKYCNCDGDINRCDLIGDEMAEDINLGS